MKPKIKKRKLIYKNKRLKIYSQNLIYNKIIQKKFFTISTYDYIWIIAKIKKKFVLVEQYRNGPKKITLEFPSGIADKQIDLRKIAIEEINEETGLNVSKLVFVEKVNIDVGRLENTAYIFFAECNQKKLFKNEDNINVKFVTENELKNLIKKNKLINNHIGAYYLAKLKKII
tara:strand:- start:95 stop:613 length:519 start_codon:yes stop_codon:yes gene_type:complete